MNIMSISRRRFAQLLGVGAAAVVVRPPLSFAKPTQPDATSSTTGGTIVRLSANENPYGPSPKALKAMTDYPRDAMWLTVEERTWLQNKMDAEDTAKGTGHKHSFMAGLKEQHCVFVS